ncbi:MAG: glycosyltransferase [Alphaproteobacteria bacterium]
MALLLVVGASMLFWASRDYAVIAPDLYGQIRGLSYSPSHLYTISEQVETSPRRINADLAQLENYTGRIRTYTVQGSMAAVPEIAHRHGITVSIGLWIGSDTAANEKEIADAIKLIRTNRRVIDRVFVGNEAILRGDLSVADLARYLDRIRRALPPRIKVGTAEPWHVWLEHQELAEHVDFVGIHLLPYWEGIPIDYALQFCIERFKQIAEKFPHKPIVIGEVGWPSDGRTRQGATASLANQAYFVRTFIAYAAEHGYDYYIMEAYDQPWKADPEGAVGAFWGMFDAEGQPKFNFTGMLRSFPEWRNYAGAAAVLTLLLGLTILGRMPRVRSTGYVVMGGLVAIVTTGILMLVDASALEYLEPSDIVFYSALVPLLLLAATIILTEGAELALSLWRVERRLVLAAAPDRPPRVSIHVPCYNEPPELVKSTLNALARLDYESFEVIVLDNNTRDPAVWRPLEDHCAALGPRFHFFHLSNVKGFKAGALNEAMKRTDPEAEFIAVIDSDYQVSPNWLKVAMPFFAKPQIAVVQAPQDYRDGHGSLFKAMCYEEYRGFFHIGMVERNEADAIIQHGTMTIVRRRALEEVGAWSAWCITEDTELGLKLFERGYSAAYIPVSLGRGVMPDTLAAFMLQRYRWVYGAMQIMKRHARAVFLGGTKLTRAQRYQFLAGWLPWISDGPALIVSFFALVWTVLMIAAPKIFDVPMAALSACALALFAVKTLKTLLLYPPKVRSGVKGAIMASVAGLSLTHTVGKAMLMGIFTSRHPFMRTPKCERATPLKQILRVAWQEVTLFTACMAALAATVISRHGIGDPATLLWVMMLCVQALPYAATIVTASVSVAAGRLPAPAATPQPEPAPLPAQKQAA